MNANVRMEEVTAIGDFILTSYTRDFEAIKNRFSTMNAVFKDAYVAKLNFVTELESTLMLSEERKGITRSLYEEAMQLSDELDFVTIYFADANLNTSIVSDIKRKLHSRNIEGAILRLESLKQFIITHHTVLTAKGMDENFADSLAAYETSLRTKNRIQNDLMNDRKQLTDANQSHYDALLVMIKTINRKGKALFKGKVTADEYTMAKLIPRVRVSIPKKSKKMKE